MRAAVMAAGLGFIWCAAPALAQGTWYTIGIAASHNDTAQVQELLLKGDEDPDEIESSGQRTALDYAATFDNMTMAKILLDHGAHVDARDPAGNTALHWAAERGNVDMIRFLIQNKATVDAANHQGATPLMLAAGQQPLQTAAVRVLIASGADPHKQDYTGRDAFGWAAGKPAVLAALNAKP